MLELMVPGGSNPPEPLYPKKNVPPAPLSPVFFFTGLSGDIGQPILVGIIFWGGRWGAARGLPWLPVVPWPPADSYWIHMPSERVRHNLGNHVFSVGNTDFLNNRVAPLVS